MYFMEYGINRTIQKKGFDMARPGITYDEVVGSINAIIASSEDPTIMRIREHLGNTGSPNTIHRHLTSWRESRPVEQRKAPELPSELKIAFVRELDRQTAEARAEVESALIATQKEAAILSKSGEELEEINANLDDSNSELLTENSDLKVIGAERDRKISELSEKLDIERVSLEQSRVETAKAINKNESLYELSEDLKRQRDLAFSDTKEAEKLRISAEKDAAVSSARLESSEDKINEFRVQFDEVKSELKLTKKELKTSAQTAENLLNENHKLKLENARLNDQITALVSDLEKCKPGTKEDH
jgi:chromosome segregation ATPase